jgi:hypothetical protein
VNVATHSSSGTNHEPGNAKQANFKLLLTRDEESSLQGSDDKTVQNFNNLTFKKSLFFGWIAPGRCKSFLDLLWAHSVFLTTKMTTSLYLFLLGKNFLHFLSGK